MTNFSLSFAHKALVAAAFSAALVGCGASESGEDELAAGKAAYSANDFANADELLSRSLLHDASNIETLIYHAKVKVERGDIRAAKESIEKALKIDPEALDVKSLHGQIAYHDRDWDTAIGEFTDLATNSSNSRETRSDAFCSLGVVANAIGDYEAARVYFIKSTRINGLNAVAHYNLARLYLDCEQFGFLDAACARFEIFVETAKGNPTLAERLEKVVNAVLPGIKQAIQDKRDEIADGKTCNVQLCNAELQKADKLWREGKFKIASMSYKDAYKANPLSAKAALGLARYFARENNTEAIRTAQKYYEAACHINPSDEKVLLEAAEFYFRSGDAMVANKVFSAALAVDPSSYQAAVGLAKTYKKLGNNAKAVELYNDYAVSKFVIKPKAPAPAPQNVNVQKPKPKPSVSSSRNGKSSSFKNRRR